MSCTDHHDKFFSRSGKFIKKDNHFNCTKIGKRQRILILCTGNSCRSQMAEGWLRSFDERQDVFSAGTHPETEVNPFAIAVMKEINIDIRKHYPKPVSLFLNTDFDYVITVCDNACKICPFFTGKIKQRFHFSIEDPADFRGSPDETMDVYRNIRDQLRDVLYIFYSELLGKF